MTGIRYMPLLLAILLVSCGPDYQPSNEFTQAVPGASITIQTDNADTVDAITQNVGKRLTDEPVLAARVLSHGHATATAYNLRFRGRCAEGAGMVSMVRSAATPVTSAPLRCSDR